MPKKTVETAVSQGNDVIVQIKANQQTLLKNATYLAMNNEPLATLKQQEKRKRNRVEYREASVYFVSPRALPYEWNNLFKTIIRVRRYTDKFNTKRKRWELQTESSYYGATRLLGAEHASKCIRDHWHIENKNHYVRDVSLAEDASRIRNNPGIFARLRSFALNLLRANQVTNVKEALFMNALNFDNVLNYQGIF